MNLLEFKAEKLHSGAHVDVKITDGDRSALIEVKGHENRQAHRAEYLQLLGYLAEIENPPKGILIVNHEFEKPIHERSESAFIPELNKIAENADIALISCVDLYKIVMGIIENKINDEQKILIRKTILSESGLINLKTFE
jgi:hypothetical protein